MAFFGLGTTGWLTVITVIIMNVYILDHVRRIERLIMGLQQGEDAKKF